MTGDLSKESEECEDTLYSMRVRHGWEKQSPDQLNSLAKRSVRIEEISTNL